jgi:hydrogenase maturation protein HypF
MIRKLILVKGLVQGVGFRPFVYKIALENSLKGFIKNSNIGVIIDIEGYAKSIDNFTRALKLSGPKLVNIQQIIIEDKEVVNYKKFEIKESINENTAITFISPDLGICNECCEDIMSVQNRRYLYPFTNCTNCGPRYSIIKALPYDRENSTMNKFEICNNCNGEYQNPKERRFYSQANCCTRCGPKLELVDKYGDKMETETPAREAIRLIKEGKILSIKGIGGFHLVCDGTNKKIIELLRIRKHRETKPFALMMKDIETVKKHCFLSIEEEKILSSNKSPIVILKSKGDGLPKNIAPGNRTLGIMLPYTPLHLLLFQEGIEILVMTSANLHGEPIIYQNQEAIDKLSEIVDYHLINNRDIYNPVDDSVTRHFLGVERVIRRGRGYSPAYFKKKGYKESLSLGSYLKNTFCFCKDGNIILSQYIGDLDNVETLNRYETAFENVRNIYDINPELITYDLHPNIPQNKYLNKFSGKKVGVYHHHAHIASVLFENGELDRVIGIAYDGSGYGSDGTVWGGEFLLSNCKDFKRVGHINLVAMPGGDKAVKDPKRMAISYLYRVYKEKVIYIMEKLNYLPASTKIMEEIKIYIQMIKKDINAPKTSSIGRFFDAVAYLLGFNKKVTSEGEAAIYLENIASIGEEGSYDFEIYLLEEKYIIDTDKIITGIIEDLIRGVPKEIISMVFHNTIIKFTVALCLKISEEYKLKKVALSGGVFQNQILLEGIDYSLNRNGYTVYTNKQIPCNDGGISLGQIVIANEREME